MSSKYTDEDLLMALPDFVNGVSLDSELENLIRKKLSEDASFREQHKELQNTFAFLSKSEFSAPPDHYFSNLSVKINERLPGSGKESWWKDLSLAWKILIPAVPALLIIFLLLLNREDSQKNFIAIDTGKKSETTSKQVDAVDEKVTDDNSEDNAKEVDNSDKATGTNDVMNEPPARVPRHRNNPVSKNWQQATNPLQVNTLADNIDNTDDQSIDETDVLLGTEETEAPVEEEFLNLSPEEQTEILLILKNS